MSEDERAILDELLADAADSNLLEPIPRDAPGEIEFIVMRLLLREASLRKTEHRQVQESLGRVSSLIASTPRMARLLLFQLSDTNSTTETAALAIMKRLTDVNSQAASLIENLKKTRDRATVLQGNALKKIDESKSLIDGMATHQQEFDSQILATNEAVNRQVGELKALTGMIHGITRTTNMLSLNASIEASRAGQSGRAFAVVASEMRKLSREVAQTAVQIDEKFTEVSGTVDAKLSTISGMIQDEAKWFQSLTIALPQLSEAFHSVVGELNALANETHGMVGSIRDAVSDALGQAQFQDITRQQVEQVQKGLAMLGRAMRDASRILSGSAPLNMDAYNGPDIAESLRASYTMIGQREIHEAILGDSDQARKVVEKRPAIELF
ncbi:MAG: methyl-accepting chemotaxis protein [Spirochaetota bacterium]